MEYQRLSCCAMSILVVALFLGESVAADSGKPVALRAWGDSAISVETYWNLSVVINPPAERAVGSNLEFQAELAVMASPTRTSDTLKLFRKKPQVAYLRDESGRPVSLDIIIDRAPNSALPTVKPFAEAGKPSPNAIRVRTVWIEQTPLVCIDSDGITMIVCDATNPPVVLTPRHEEQIGPVDVLIVRLSEHNARPDAAVALAKRLRPRLTVPIRQGEADSQGRDKANQSLADALGLAQATQKAKGNTLAITSGRGLTREKPAIVVLGSKPWDMPKELQALFERMDIALPLATEIFAPLSAKQMNHRPADGTHTARWNAEHIMGRELGFFTAIYSNLDPAIPHIDLNPAQMPPDYKAAHPDWNGAEEVRQIERASALVHRFAYLLDGMEPMAKPKGSPWSIKQLCETMHGHFSEHLANVKKKFELPDWPKE